MAVTHHQGGQAREQGTALCWRDPIHQVAVVEVLVTEQRQHGVAPAPAVNKQQIRLPLYMRLVRAEACKSIGPLHCLHLRTATVCLCMSPHSFKCRKLYVTLRMLAERQFQSLELR